MPRNAVVPTRARHLPGSEDARLREQLNAAVRRVGQLCDQLDADSGVAGTGYAAAVADAVDAPSLIGDEDRVVRDGPTPPAGPPAAGLATSGAFAVTLPWHTLGAWGRRAALVLVVLVGGGR